MTRADRDALSRPAVLAYWGTIIAGLVLFTTTRSDARGAVIALWIGALGGTLLGQYLALRAARLWIVGLVLAVGAMYGAPLVPPGDDGAALWQAFIPALLCGYWSLGDRASIAACWFPAVIWMLSILDRTDGQLVADGVGASLLAGFAVLFLVMMRARETRRVALWQRFAAVPLAEPKATELLREPPARQLARAVWGLSVAAITVGITLWLAPRLWHVEALTGERVRLAAGGGRGLPCCPVGDDVDSGLARVKEYFDLGRGHDPHEPPPREGLECQACDAPVRAIDTPGEPVVAAGAGAVGDGVAVATGERAAVPGGPGAYVPARAERPVRAPDNTPSAAAPPIATVAPPSPALPSTRSTEAARHLVPAPPPRPPVVQAPAAPTAPARERHASAPEVRFSIVPWLLALGGSVLVFQLVALGLRPLRRLIILRHLRRPFWDETVAQQISNLWQLALVGLRDAGWRPGSAEAPHALARRVAIAELERCATILERARHGLGLDAEDLDIMRRAADVTYAAARAPLGPVARAIGWIRWPLV